MSKCFSDLVDQISAFESQPDPVHYTTRFLDGLQPGVRVLVAIQQPKDLDTAYTLALLYEELGDGGPPLNLVSSSPPVYRRQFSQPPPPPPPPAKWVWKTVEEKRNLGNTAPTQENRWVALKAYRRSKGLCFTCGEKWGKDHQCKTSIQLHVVQEMVAMLQESDTESDQNGVCQQRQCSLMLKPHVQCSLRFKFKVRICCF